MINTDFPSNKKSAHRLSTRKQVREIFKGAVEYDERTRNTVEGSKRSPPWRELNLEAEPTRRRMRESF
jgi:hypothetical protein